MICGVFWAETSLTHSGEVSGLILYIVKRGIMSHLNKTRKMYTHLHPDQKFSPPDLNALFSSWASVWSFCNSCVWFLQLLSLWTDGSQNPSHCWKEFKYAKDAGKSKNKRDLEDFMKPLEEERKKMLWNTIKSHTHVNSFINAAIILSCGLRVNSFYSFVNNKQLWSSSQPVIRYLVTFFNSICILFSITLSTAHTTALYYLRSSMLFFLRPWADWIILPL